MTVPPGSFDWTAKRIEILKEMWERGCSSSEIEIELGAPSRNSVIGKAHRLKLKRLRRNPNPTDPDPTDKRRGVENTLLFAGGFTGLRNGPRKPPSLPPLSKDQKEFILGKGNRLLEFDDLPSAPKYCRWPINEPKRDEFYLFCGAPTCGYGPYCEAHLWRAHRGKAA